MSNYERVAALKNMKLKGLEKRQMYMSQRSMFAHEDQERLKTQFTTEISAFEKEAK